MTKQKSLKKSLAKSAVAMTLCAGMLIGSTYAWFSDSASTKDVTITAGNLDVDIVNEDGTTLQGQSIFRDLESADFDWEPGAMWISDTFKIKNLGNLALWYSLTLQTENTSEAEDSKSILDVVQMKVVDTQVLQKNSITAPAIDDTTDHKARQEFWDKISETEGAEVHTGTINGKDQTSPSLEVVLYWEPSDSTAIDTNTNPDNKYNIKADDYNSKKLSATFKLNVFATQTPEEKDGFGKNYDDSAKGGAFYAAMEDAVAEQVDSLKQQNVNMTFSVDEATGEPKLTVEPTAPGGQGASANALGESYNAVKKAIADALATQKDNIQSLKIGGVEPTDFQAENLEKAFVQCLANKYGLTLGEDGNIQMDQEDAMTAIKEWGKQLKNDDYKMNIPVEVVDKNGADVTYNVEINVDAYRSLIDQLASSLEG